MKNIERILFYGFSIILLFLAFDRLILRYFSFHDLKLFYFYLIPFIPYAIIVLVLLCIYYVFLD